MRSHRSSGWPRKRWLAPPPALLTRTSTAPSRCLTWDAIAATCSALVTSQGTPRLRTPRPRTSAATASRSDGVRATTATSAPARASARATHRPMPRLAPVTRAVLPARLACSPAPIGTSLPLLRPLQALPVASRGVAGRLVTPCAPRQRRLDEAEPGVQLRRLEDAEVSSSRSQDGVDLV